MKEESSRQRSLPQVPLPDPRIYLSMGQERLTHLVKAVYRRLGDSAIRQMFPVGEQALDEAAEKSALFFVGICGGPPLFERRFGPPQMRARHQRFTIDETSRLVWLDCWHRTLFDDPSISFPTEYREGFWHYLEVFSTWMVNA